MARSKRSSGRNSKRSSKRRRSMRRRRQSGGLLQMLGGGEKRNVHWQNFFDLFFGFVNIFVVDGAWKKFLTFFVFKYVVPIILRIIYLFIPQLEVLTTIWDFVVAILVIENLYSIYERHKTGNIRPGHYFGIEVFKGIKPTKIDKTNWTWLVIILGVLFILLNIIMHIYEINFTEYMVNFFNNKFEDEDEY